MTASSSSNRLPSNFKGSYYVIPISIGETDNLGLTTKKAPFPLYKPNGGPPAKDSCLVVDVKVSSLGEKYGIQVGDFIGKFDSQTDEYVLTKHKIVTEMAKKRPFEMYLFREKPPKKGSSKTSSDRSVESGICTVDESLLTIDEESAAEGGELVVSQKDSDGGDREQQKGNMEEEDSKSTSSSSRCSSCCSKRGQRICLIVWFSTLLLVIIAFLSLFFLREFFGLTLVDEDDVTSPPAAPTTATSTLAPNNPPGDNVLPPSTTIGTCGNGFVGDGRCPNPNECCSSFGYCGTGVICSTVVHDDDDDDDDDFRPPSVTSWPPNSYAAQEIHRLISTEDAMRLMNEYVLVSQRSSPQDLEQSSEYRWKDFVDAYEQMASNGIAGSTFMAPTVKAGIVNIALFLAQGMHETIQYNACDENNWSIGLGVPDYPLTSSCGQAGQDYQEYKCDASESHMECPIDPNMSIQASTHAVWGGAPPPLFCAPKSITGPTLPRWTWLEECGPAGYNDIPNFPQPWINDALLHGVQTDSTMCNAYEGQFSGSFTYIGCDPNLGCPNTDAVDTDGGRVHYDVEGCCWWGRGVIQTTGPCNMGKLNYYLAGKQTTSNKSFEQINDDAPFKQLNFCTQPNLICDGPKSLRWISGMFYWLSNVQDYTHANYQEYLFSSILNQSGDDVFDNPTSETAMYLVQATSGLVNRGCPDIECEGSGHVHALEERTRNFMTAITALKHIFDSRLYPAPQGDPAPTSEGEWYSRDILCNKVIPSCPCAIKWSKNGDVSCANWIQSERECRESSTVAAAWCL